MAKMKSYAGTVGSMMVNSPDFLVFKFQPMGERPENAPQDQKPFTCVLPDNGVKENDAILIKGYWKKHDKFGWQFWVMDCAPTMPTEASDIQIYLAAGHVDGIGPELASRLVKRFGSRTLEVMKNDPVALTAVEGIGPGKADLIHAHTRHLVKLQGIQKQLADWGVPAKTTAKLVAKYDAEALTVVRQNPWKLMSEYGESLKTVDRIASLSGIVANKDRLREIALISLSETQKKVGLAIGVPLALLHTTQQTLFPGETINWSDALSDKAILTLDDEAYLLEPAEALKIRAMLHSSDANQAFND